MDPLNNTGTALRAARNSLNSALGTSNPSGKNKLGKEDFLKLLMAQITNQNPLNPMDSAAMMSQLTQMGSLEQMIGINNGIARLHESQAEIARANAYTFLDKDVSIRGGNTSVKNGEPTSPIIFDISREASEVKVTVLGPGNVPVRNMALGQQGAGNHEAIWDGRDNGGNLVANGDYSYSIVAKGSNGETIPVNLYSRGKVSGIRFVNGRNLVKVNGRESDVRDIVELTNHSQRLFGGRKPLPLQPNFTPKPPRLQTLE